MSKWRQLLREETHGLHWRLLLAQFPLAFLPPHVGSRLRVAFLRTAGFAIGQGTLMWGAPTITGPGDLYGRLTIGHHCWFNVDCFMELGDTITIGDQVAVGQQVMLLTTKHLVGSAGRRAGAVDTAPVHIEEGAWLSTRCTILPGVTVGAGAVVAAGAVVTKSVLPNQLVGGVPARLIRTLTPDVSRRDQELFELMSQPLAADQPQSLMEVNGTR